MRLNSLETSLAGASQVGILLGQNPSLDAMASALALSLSLANSGKRTEVFCPTLPSVGLSYLVGINKVKQQLGGSGNGLIISLPYKQGAIEKISYDIVGERINLTVVPGLDGLSFTTDDINYEMPSTKIDLFIAIGIVSEDELASFYPASLESTVINIDYSNRNSGYGNVSLVDPSYSSYSEIVAKLLITLALPIDTDIAQNLLSGIVDATGNFQSEQTSPFAFETVGLLMQKGARREARPILAKDAFFEEEEQKAQAVSSQKPWDQRANVMPRRQQSFPSKKQQQPFPRHIGGQSQPYIKPASVAKPQDNTTAKNDQGQTPKDWFEPKIYRGSGSTS